LELWGGHECTVNRVGDRYFDQTLRSGHQFRAQDLERFADLGVRALRYPVLWERISPEHPERRDFAWTDERLERIRRLGMRPIAGLVHHGGGPVWTSLVDDAGFARGLAAHARAVAERYPWIEDWTPVNEPLTTARFSCLYGLWWPHARDDASLWRALFNQIDAVRLCMREIRAVNPQARLVQTEDLGHTHARPALCDQARFENDRRWLTFDLLCGRVTPDHVLHDWLCKFDPRVRDRLKAIADDPCPPDVLGVNHYLTSERFLDERLDRYPPHVHGGNGFKTYADVEAVRVAADGVVGVKSLLQATWNRYGLPVAVTESHNGCTRDEQARWLYEGWRACCELEAEGVDVRALTAWSLLGSYDWNSLLTKDAGHYECGVFDLRGGEPRATGMVRLLKALARGEEPAELDWVLAAPGWWRRDDTRLEYAPVAETVPVTIARRTPTPPPFEAAPILITGATGTLGQAFARACRHRALKHVLTTRKLLALDDAAAVEAALERFRPAAVINAAGWVRVDDAEADCEPCLLANAHGAELLARACARRGTPFATFSSDLVFDGALGRPYVESDAPRPLNVYGHSKALAETAVLAAWPQALVVRTAAFFSHQDPHNFAVHVLDALHHGRAVQAAEDCFVSPTYVPDLVNTTLDLLIDGDSGLRHLTNVGRVSWAGFARMLAERAGLDPELVRGFPAEALGFRAPRPPDVALDSERGRLLRPLDAAIDRFLAGYAPGGLTREICPSAKDLEQAAE
jgi:dTDP-4-dehydrorhamnose reductase